MENEKILHNLLLKNCPVYDTKNCDNCIYGVNFAAGCYILKSCEEEYKEEIKRLN